MDSTSNRTPIDLIPTDNEVTFEGWQRLESVIYDLWLSPCKTYLVQHYSPRSPQELRIMRASYVHDLNIQDFKLRQLNRMGQIIGYKTYDFQIIHEFTGCHWYGNEPFPDDFPALLDDLHTGQISWPVIRPANLYRNPEGELRVIGACTAFEYSGQPINLNYWGYLFTKDELREAQAFAQNGEVDTRLWFDHRWGRHTCN